MSQTETGKATAADERKEAARSFVRTVKTAARRKYTPEEKIRIVPEGFRRRILGLPARETPQIVFGRPELGCGLTWDITTAEVFHGEQGVVEEGSNGRMCPPGTGADLLAGAQGLSLNSALILSK